MGIYYARSALRRLGYDVEFSVNAYILRAHFGMSAVRHVERVVETAEQRQGRVHNLLAEDAELLCRQLVLRHSVVIVESGLCRPADVECTLYVGVSPSEYLRKFLPVAHVLKLKMFYRRTRHDESVELLVLQFVEIGVEAPHVLRRSVFRRVCSQLHERQLYVEW